MIKSVINVKDYSQAVSLSYSNYLNIKIKLARKLSRANFRAINLAKQKLKWKPVFALKLLQKSFSKFHKIKNNQTTMKFCPKCKSEDVEIKTNAMTFLGMNVGWTCNDCGFNFIEFPEKEEKPKKKIKEKRKKKWKNQLLI